MAMNDIETFYCKDAKPFRRWCVQVQGTGEVLGVYPRRDIAREVGKAIAKERRVEWFMKNRRGEWIERNTYTGHDPWRSKG